MKISLKETVVFSIVFLKFEEILKKLSKIEKTRKLRKLEN